MKIKKLSTETINLISAGEVIEGPGDVLKELIENSLDANATEITVEIKSAGIDFLQIKDNGSGILKEDLEICLEKYTTSKLKDINDLYEITSFGFRGEALSTIDAVSKLKIISSTTQDGQGYLLENRAISLVPAKKGTIITIEDLFYNVPVRKKFLKSKSFEYSKLYETFLASVLLNPDVTFKFISEKKNIIFPKTDFENRLVQVYGSDIKSKAIKIDVENNLFKLRGVLTNPSNPIYFPSNYLFINKRYVFSPQIYKSIIGAYKDYLMIQQKPFFILFIDFDPKTIDVNVHPKKRVVKLQNEMVFLMELKRELSQKIDVILGKELNKTNYNSLNQFMSNTHRLENNFTPPSYSKQNTGFFQNKNHSLYDSQKNLFSEQDNKLSFSEELVLFEHKITKVLGQVKDTFIVCETTDGLILIDQHAADERINLEKNRLKYDFVEKQTLIAKIPLTFLSEFHKDLLLNNKDKLNELGFSYSLEDSNYFLKTIPLFLDRYFDKNIFLNILKDLEEGNFEISKLKDNLLKLKSCKESIKANDPLTIQDQINLIKKLGFCKDKGICAHGRPTIIFISLKDVDKLFKRII